MRKRKKRLQKWPLWRVRVWESISSMFLPTFLPKVASLPCNTGQNKGQYWENALWLYGMYCMFSRDLMDISFGEWSGSSRWTGLLQRGQSRATLFCCKWSRSSKWTGLLQKGRTRTTTFLLQMIRIIQMNWLLQKGRSTNDPDHLLGPNFFQRSVFTYAKFI